MTTSPLSDISSPSAPSDIDAFSVISASTPEGPPIKGLCGHPPTQSSNSPISHLAFLVERGINLCETRRSLEEGILKGLERHEKFCLDAVESSKGQLAMMRRNAVDIAARLKGASGGIVSVTLPWLDGVEIGAYDSEKKYRRPTPISVPHVPMGPMAPPPSPPEPITSPLYSTLDTKSSALAMCSRAEFDYWFPAVPSIHSPGSPPPLSVVPSPNPIPTRSLSPFGASIPAISLPSATTLPAIGRPISLGGGGKVPLPGQSDSIYNMLWKRSADLFYFSSSSSK